MKTLILRDIVDNTVSNIEGCKLLAYLKREKENGQKVILKVDNDQILSSSFLNSSIGEYLEIYGIEAFKNEIQFKGSRVQFERLVKYIEKFEQAHLA